MSEQPEPDIFIRILNKVELIDGIAADVREIKKVQREHGLKLAEHDRRFDRMDQRFDQIDLRFGRVDQTLAEHTLRLNQLDAAVVEVHRDVMQHTRDIAELKAG